MDVALRLTWEQAGKAIHVGADRRLSAIASGAVPRWGQTRPDWNTDIEAAGAEYALALLLGIDWPNPPPDTDGDVGSMFVRHTPRRDGRLILHPEDKGDRLHWLVVGTMPDYTVVGCIIGGGGKRPEFWCDPGTGRPAYFIPQARLLATARLLDAIRAA